MRTLVKSHRDPGPVLVNGLPAAARAGVHHPWVLEESLGASIHLAAAGRDPRQFLEQAVAPLAEAAGEDREAFRRLSVAVQKRMLDAPEEAWPAVRAAASVCHGREEWLDEALSAVLQRLVGEREPENARALLQALPQLSPLTVIGDELWWLTGNGAAPHIHQEALSAVSC